MPASVGPFGLWARLPVYQRGKLLDAPHSPSTRRWRDTGMLLQGCPVVVNMTDDNGDNVVDTLDVPDIAFVSYQFNGTCPANTTCGCCNSSGVLRVVSGRCEDGTLVEHFSVGANEIEADTGIAGIWLDNSGGLAVGDIDADGQVDIVATVQNGGTIAFERTGTVKWYQPMYPASGVDHLAATQPALADVDGMPEVIQSRVVLNGEDGTLQWQGTLGIGTNGFMGPVPSLGDIDLAGGLDLLAGASAYKSDGNELFSFTYSVPRDESGCDDNSFPCDGFTATGNFDSDDESPRMACAL